MSNVYTYAKLLQSNKEYKCMDYKELLNDRQYEAVSTNAQYVRIVAGAGSGKTRVLTYRLSYLVGEMGVDPTSIMAIAFTNKVASEMKIRAAQLLGNVKNALAVSTFHSFCAKFLRIEIDNIGFPNNFTILDEEDSETLIKNIGVELGLKRNDELVKRTIGFVSYNKMLGYYPEDVLLDKDADEDEKKALKMFHMYEKRKAEMLSLDFDDLLLQTIYILENCPKVRERWQNRISNILVDEYQDTNNVQYKLIKLLMNDRTSLYVVGDPDQTIYTWRGANQRLILDFVKDFPTAVTIILDRNYRSTTKILDTANKLIAHNKDRVPKDLYTKNENGEDVVINSSFSKNKEAEYVVNQIENLHFKGVLYKDIAILYRAAYLTLPFENELMSRRIPYEIYGGLKFFQRKEIKDLLAYFRLIYNERDDISFERIINVPRRGIGKSTIELLKAEKEKYGLSFYQYIKHIDKYETELSSRNVVSLTMLINKIEKLRDKINENLEAVSKLLEDFVTDIGYYDYLADSDEDAEERVGNVKTLFENVNAYIKDNPDATFDDYLENAALQSSQDEIKDVDKVALMTIHVAKGLEFDYVFVVSVIDGIFPSARTLEEKGHKGEEEERRLCYVAFTRAKKKLFVTYNKSYSFVLSAQASRSRFIDEAGLKEAFAAYSSSRSMFQNNSYNSEKFGYYSDFDDNNDNFFDSYKEFDELEIEDNGVTNWKVGDHAIHDVFGKGVVTKVIDDSIIEVDFENHGKKSIMSNHPKIHKDDKGAEA